MPSIRPGLSEDEAKRRLLPVMQASRPRPRLTFTYEFAPLRRPRFPFLIR